MRINLEQGINHCQLIYDTYNNDQLSLISVLAFTTQQAAAHKKALILTDLCQPDVDSATLYTDIAKLLHTQQIDRFIGIGPQMINYAHAFHLPETYFYKDVQALLTSHKLDSLNKNVVVVKGNSAYDMGQIINKLRQKCHDAVLEIDLTAIEQNLIFFRNKLAKSTRIMAMVKAAAYGNSSFEIAHFLQQWHVEYLAVCYADEGVILRENGIQLPIMVMNPSPASFDKLLTYQLEPTIYSLAILKDWKNFLNNKLVHTGLHIKLDTGMHRLGFMQEDIEELIDTLQCMPYVIVKSIFSHLAAPASPNHQAYTHAQAKLFQQLVHYIEKKLGTPLLKHLLNTAGTQYYPEYQFDMVRLGIGLYGFHEEGEQHLKIANTLKTIISQIKEVPAGATIGYERKWVTHQPTRLAIVAIGYADGFRRILSNGRGTVWINGELAPVIGNVCMDMTMVDITNIEAREGDEVVIFGTVLPIQEMAAATSTIVHEILTNVNERIKRVYYKTLPMATKVAGIDIR